MRVEVARILRLVVNGFKVVALGVVFIASSTLAGSAQADSPYTIPVILSLTGSGAFAGGDESKALQYYETITNRGGGIRGRPVHFALHDDQSTPAVALQIANTILAAHPAVVLGCTLAQSCSAIVPQFANGPVLWSFSNAFSPPKGGFVFIPIYRSEDGIAADLRYLAGTGVTRIALLSSTDSSGQANEHATEAALKRPEFGAMQVVASEHFNPTDLSVAAQVARVKAAAPQALLVWASGTPFGTVLHGLADAGLDIPLATTAANMVTSQLAGYGGALPHDLLFSGLSFLNVNRGKRDNLRVPVDEFVTSFERAGSQANMNAIAAWDSAKLTVAALRQLGVNATASQLRAYIENLHGFAGAGGVYDFREGDQHGLGQDAVLLVRWAAARSSYTVVTQQGGAPLAPAK